MVNTLMSEIKLIEYFLVLTLEHFAKVFYIF